MKKLLMIVFALGLVTSTFAQFNQGRMLAGGSIGFSSITDKTKSGSTTVTNGTETRFSFAPSFGYFVIDNLAVGAAIDFASYKYNYSGGGGSNKGSAITAGPFVRYYFKPGIFGQAAIGLGSSKYTPAGGTETKYSVTALSLGVGYAWFLNDHVAIEPLLKYTTETDSYSGAGSVKDLYSGLAFSIGIQAYLGDRK